VMHAGNRVVARPTAARRQEPRRIMRALTIEIPLDNTQQGAATIAGALAPVKPENCTKTAAIAVPCQSARFV